MKIIGIIPARMSSSRFPGKPLAKILNKAMIYHVYFRSKMSNCLNDVYIATCDEAIRQYCEENRMNVIMTKDTHERASDRTAEAVIKIENKSKEKIDIVVMIQGDEPMLTPHMIDLSVAPLLRDNDTQIVNLMCNLQNYQEHEDPNEVKVVVDNNLFALYFSREPIPSRKKCSQQINMYKQVCIIPFRRSFLKTFNELSQTPLEITESVDMLRVLEHGYKVKMVFSQIITYSVDTDADLKNVENRMKNDPLNKKYLIK